MSARKACFLDRDGVIIEEENYLSDPAKARLCPGAAEALKLLREAGYLLVVVSNQSGVARGYFTMKEVEAVRERIESLLAEARAGVDAWYHCRTIPRGRFRSSRSTAIAANPSPDSCFRPPRSFP
jgi:D-glycero-D-manno-heptose 1,7-bisphosphate phosphatase